MISGIQFYENGMPNIMQKEEIMLKLNEFRHNHHLSGGKILAKFIDVESRKESYSVGRRGLTSFAIVNHCSEVIEDPDFRITSTFKVVYEYR
jgi:hypothetical protein